MCRPERIRQRVVDVAGFGGSVAAGKATRQIPDADELLKLGRQPVTPLWRSVARKPDVSYLGTAADQLGYGSPDIERTCDGKPALRKSECIDELVECATVQ